MNREPRPPGDREATRLVLLFGALYFIQGIAEPTEGLIAQPIRSLLKSWDYTTAAIAGFGALLAIPWSLKPLYGLLTDFVPIAGTRRRSYLVLTSVASVLGLGILYVIPVPKGDYWLLLGLLLLPTVGVAFSDVVVDALMVERGQPLGLTGRLQSAQWAAMYGGGIIAGVAGGWFSQYGLQREALLVCAVTGSGTLLLTLFCIREERRPAPPAGRFGFALRELLAAVRTPAVLSASAFLFLWNFNPFTSAVLYVHLTVHLGIGEQFFGYTNALFSVGAINGSIAYGFYCRRVRIPLLVHLSIATGILSTLAYALVTGAMSAGIVSVVVGFTYMTGSLVQFDLAARACPIPAAGTTFALLMSLSNFSLSLSSALGGRLYDEWTQRWDATTAFNLLVVAGALTTSACWLLVPLLNRTCDDISEGDETSPTAN
jgi:MFS family permease